MYQNTTVLMQENEFEIVVCETAAILSQSQCVNERWGCLYYRWCSWWWLYGDAFIHRIENMHTTSHRRIELLWFYGNLKTTISTGFIAENFTCIYGPKSPRCLKSTRVVHLLTHFCARLYQHLTPSSTYGVLIMLLNVNQVFKRCWHRRAFTACF